VTLLAAVAVAGVLASAATANAAILSPNKFDFGEHEVGTISAPQSFTLEVQCAKYNFEIFFCEAPETVKTSISASPPFAVQSTDCPPELVGFASFPTTIKVVFQPTVAGPVTGKLNTGGPTAELLGTGLAIPGAGGGPPPAASSPPASSPPSSSPPATASPPPPPSNQLGFAKPKLDKHHGTATLTVTVPGPGTLALAGNSILVPRVAVGPVSPLITVQAAGQVKLRIRAKGKAKATLERTGKVTVKATVTFTPTGGTGAGYIEPIHLVKTS
jgi:hypothetical protein